MNCLEVSAMVDSRDFADLIATERKDLEAHARTCARCASQWVAGMGLADVRIPPMPAGLALRCRPVGSASTAVPVRQRKVGRAVLAGVFVALAAAAAVQVAYLTSSDAPQSAKTESKLAAVEAPPAEPAGAALSPDMEVPEISAPPAATAMPSLPLLPMPPPQRSANETYRVDWILARVIERYPELVDGPGREGRVVAAIALYADGRILSEAMRYATDAEFLTVENELRQSLPTDGGQTYHSARQKGTQLPDGRILRNLVMLHVHIVGDQYDAARSGVRVAEVVRRKHADLMGPATGSDINRLVVFMSEDGQIQRESVVTQRTESWQFQSGDPEAVAYLAQWISSSLGLDVDQIGLIGVTGLQDGPATVIGEDGNAVVSDKLRVLQVFYAWPRRAGESGPVVGQGAAFAKPKFDTASALAIVERYMPDAFTYTDRSSGDPVVVLTARGEFVRAMRVRTDVPIPQRARENELLMRNADRVVTERLTNSAGKAASVMFVWEKADPGK